jgi:hypothetical protein
MVDNQGLGESPRRTRQGLSLVHNPHLFVSFDGRGHRGHFTPVKCELVTQFLCLTRRACYQQMASMKKPRVTAAASWMGSMEKASDPGGRLSESRRFPSQPAIEAREFLDRWRQLHQEWVLDRRSGLARVVVHASSKRTRSGLRPGPPRGKEDKIKDLTFWPTGNRGCRSGKRWRPNCGRPHGGGVDRCPRNRRGRHANWLPHP